MAKRTAKTSGWVAQKAGDISIRVAESIVRRVGPKQGFGAQLQVYRVASGYAPVRLHHRPAGRANAGIVCTAAVTVAEAAELHCSFYSAASDVC